MIDYPDSNRDVLICLADGDWGYGYYDTEATCDWRLYLDDNGGLLKEIKDIKQTPEGFDCPSISSLGLGSIFGWSEIKEGVLSIIKMDSNLDLPPVSELEHKINHHLEQQRKVYTTISWGPISTHPGQILKDCGNVIGWVDLDPVAEANDKIADRLDSWLNDKSLWEDD